MKTICFFFTAAIVLVATSLTSAQDKTDSIKVIYESARSNEQGETLEYYIDSVLLKNGFVETSNPGVEKINIVKNKMYITAKKDVPYNLVTLQSLADKYLKKQESTGVLYTVDGKLITEAESVINEKDILSISIANDQVISSLSSGKVTIFKVLTRSKLNVENANRTYIRGNGLGSR
jgi:hypothetical protein